jgi:hypothetical protein
MDRDMNGSHPEVRLGPGDQEERWSEVHRHEVAQIANTAEPAVVDRLGQTLHQACGRLVHHLRTAENEHEQVLVGRLLTVVGSALAATRFQRFETSSRLYRASQREREAYHANVACTAEVQVEAHRTSSTNVSQPATDEHPLGDWEMANIHRVQWDTAEMCYSWLVEWEDVEVRSPSQLDRLHRSLQATVHGLCGALGEVERMRE